MSMFSNPLGGHNGYWTTDPTVYGSASQQARYQALIAAQQAFLGSLNPLQGATIGPPEPEPIEDAGIRAGEVRAWRIWDMDRHGFLESVSVGVTWAPGVPMEGDPDSGRYGYGVHAFKSAHEALREAGARVIKCVVGQIDLWGTIVEQGEVASSILAGSTSNINALPDPKKVPPCSDERENACPALSAAAVSSL